VPLINLLLYLLFLIPPSKSSQFPRNGTATPSTFLKWELTYHATSYLPTCGQSTETEGSDYWSNCPQCDVPMTTFNSSSSPSTLNVAVYDPSGLISDPSNLGMGTQLCLCYTLLHIADNVPLDICMLFGANGEIMTATDFWTGEVAMGIQQPNHRKTPLPLCKDVGVDVPTVTGSGTGSVTQTSYDYVPSSTGTSSSGGTESSTSTGNDGGGGLSREAVISLAVAIPGCIVAIITLWAMCSRRRHSHLPY